MTRDGNTRDFLIRRKQTSLLVSGRSSFRGVQVSHLEEEKVGLPAGDAVLGGRVGNPGREVLSPLDALCTVQELGKQGPDYNVYITEVTFDLASGRPAFKAVHVTTPWSPSEQFDFLRAGLGSLLWCVWVFCS